MTTTTSASATEPMVEILLLYGPHEGGTKFYELLLVKNIENRQILLQKRWGKMAQAHVKYAGQRKIMTGWQAPHEFRKFRDEKRNRGYNFLVVRDEAMPYSKALGFVKSQGVPLPEVNKLFDMTITTAAPIPPSPVTFSGSVLGEPTPAPIQGMEADFMVIDELADTETGIKTVEPVEPTIAEGYGSW